MCQCAPWSKWQDKQDSSRSHDPDKWFSCGKMCSNPIIIPCNPSTSRLFPRNSIPYRRKSSVNCAVAWSKRLSVRVFWAVGWEERINQWALLYFDNTSTCNTSSTIPVAHNACLEIIQTMLQIWANHLWNMRLCKKTRTQPCHEMGLAILETDLNGIQWFSLHLLGHYKYLEIEFSSMFILFPNLKKANFKRLIPLK